MIFMASHKYHFKFHNFCIAKERKAKRYALLKEAKQARFQKS